MSVIFQRTITLPDPDVFQPHGCGAWRQAMGSYPGVYAFYVDEECVYVGKSVNSCGARVWAHLMADPGWGTEDAQKAMHDRVRAAAGDGTLTVHCFRCPAPNEVEGDVIACLRPTMQGKGRWHRVNHGGASVDAKCVRIE
jgi:hypothetical protein